MKQKVRSHPKRQRRRLFVKEWRKHRLLTQDQLAERAGVSQGMISQLEKTPPGTDYTGETLEKLAFALQCEPADLMMRNPLDPEAPWSIWDSLDPPEKRIAVEMLKGIKRASGQ